VQYTIYIIPVGVIYGIDGGNITRSVFLIPVGNWNSCCEQEIVLIPTGVEVKSRPGVWCFCHMHMQVLGTCSDRFSCAGMSMELVIWTFAYPPVNSTAQKKKGGGEQDIDTDRVIL
jgi:hypothetical protein